MNLRGDVEQDWALTKAVIRMSEQLALSRHELSLILGSTESFLSQLFSHALYLDRASKEGQAAILLLRLYRSLATLFGGNAQQCQLWLRSDNQHLLSQPIILMQSIEGLVRVMQYLDAMREKN